MTSSIAINSAPTSTIDVGPTFYDYAGAEALQTQHGQSLRPLLETDDATREYALREWELHPNRAGVALSLRTVLDRRQKQRTSRRMATFTEGQRVSGTIVRKTDFGFFVDIGGIDGLLHVSRVERHNELRVQNGEEPVTFEAKQPVDVVVSRVDLDRGRVGLDLPDPDDPTDGYEVSDEAAPAANEVTGILKDLSAEGANVWIEDGVTGWLSARRFDGQSPRPGELRRFRIVSRDDSGRLELSLRLVGDDPEDDDE